MGINNAEIAPNTELSTNFHDTPTQDISNALGNTSKAFIKALGKTDKVIGFPNKTNSDQQQNIVRESSSYAYKIVSQDLQHEINHLSNTEKYSSNSLSILSKLQALSSAEELPKVITNLAKDISLLDKRLSRAVEVDYKAYLPEKAPVLYDDWKKDPQNKGKNALDCLEEIYGKYLQQGILFQDDLGGKKGLDAKLLKAIDNICFKQEEKLSNYIPKKTERIENLSKALTKEKSKAINALYKAKLKKEK